MGEAYFSCPGCGEPGLDVCSEEAREPDGVLKCCCVGLVGWVLDSPVKVGKLKDIHPWNEGRHCYWRVAAGRMA